MDRSKFAADVKKEPIWKGQRWLLSDMSNGQWLPSYIEIVEVVTIREGDDMVRKCKIDELAGYIDGEGKISIEKTAGRWMNKGTQFMLCGDILTYYEPI